MVSPTFLLNSAAMVVPSTTSPREVELSRCPDAGAILSALQSFSAGSPAAIVSGTPKETTIGAPGLAGKPYWGKAAATPETRLISSTLDMSSQGADWPSGGPTW